jgi:hypothetical protein
MASRGPQPENDQLDVAILALHFSPTKTNTSRAVAAHGELLQR